MPLYEVLLPSNKALVTIRAHTQVMWLLLAGKGRDGYICKKASINSVFVISLIHLFITTPILPVNSKIFFLLIHKSSDYHTVEGLYLIYPNHSENKPLLLTQFPFSVCQDSLLSPHCVILPRSTAHYQVTINMYTLQIFYTCKWTSILDFL